MNVSSPKYRPGRPWCRHRDDLITGVVWLAFAAVVLAISATSVAAARPSLWKQHGFEDFKDGEATGVSITSQGTVELAPELDELAQVAAERVWSLVSGPNGSVYVGTGDGGHVFAVDEDGETSLLFDSPEIAVHALALSADGVLYAGTAPEGIIYRIPPDGDAEVLARTGTHYVWDLELDDSGALLAATGEQGLVLSIAADGAADTLLTVPNRHVMAILRTGERLFAATAGSGFVAAEGASPSGARVYEIESGQGRLVYEADYGEISRMVSDGEGGIFVVALRQEEEDAKSVILHIDALGTAVPVWDVEAVIFDLVREGEDALLVAVGESGELYRLPAGKRRFDLVARIDSLAPHRLLSHPGSGRMIVGGAHSGRLMTLSSRIVRQGRLESAVHDFHTHSQWGRLEWRADLPDHTSIGFQTRSGNSQEPDESWSEWTAESSRPGAVDSPPARYLQYAAVLHTSDDSRSPVLREVTVAASQTNLRPRITELKIFPYRSGQSGEGGKVQTAGNQSSRNGRGSVPQRKSLRIVRWKAGDANGDRLSYSLYLRGGDQEEWKLVEENSARNSLIWDTETMPEGMTEMKLVASDHPDNSAPGALTDERVSEPFLLDNSPPSIRVELSGESPPKVKIEIEDRISPIKRVQYTVDYGDRVYPVDSHDGIFDGLHEESEFVLKGLAPGEHVISVQAWDRLDNVGVEQLIVYVE